MHRQIVLDTETTGLDPKEHRIIEIGAVEMIDRRLTGAHFHTYINPEREIDPQATAVHGLKYAALQGEPLFKDIMDKLIEFVGQSELIIHNAPFDLGFLHWEFGRTQRKFKPFHEYCKILDTLVLARELHPGQKNNLDALCKRYEVDNSKREYHGALLDAQILAQVYLRMTGGQSSLFTDGNQVHAGDNSALSSAKVGSVDITHLSADPEELKAHHEYLEFLRRESKKEIEEW